MPGLIALDIDGTLTDSGEVISPEVSAYLSALVSDGWGLVFITGRTFSDGFKILKPLPFPYYFAVQNGAITLKMPQQEIVSKHTLGKEIFPAMEKICQDEPTDFVLFTGFEYQDYCYYRPQHFSNELLDYLNARALAFNSVWHGVESFENLAITNFPSLKCFGKIESTSRISQRIEKEIGLHAPLIKDPFQMGYYVVQATNASVNKGSALKDLKQKLQIPTPIIAAGDDNNDLSMLEEADIRVIMATAPDHLLRTATVIAPPAREKGIIQGIQKALNLL
ncbi:HAD family hydrolase [Parachlamydia sp. AcF125]|uniref:HAD family hydrolase n=1 Tax=Parachlamydia sp. AcF125 TaxID=2795736 RepID=UPI001BC95742|nr:HAD family hydrolase [Parachlamydia sp. AcF125]MBS4168922.1 Sugar phosphatase YidA [Parachlamydia sp. AcF125]